MSQPFDSRDYDLERLAEKRAEIQRLKEALHDAGVRNGQLVLLKPLITELCDALAECDPSNRLILKAKKAIQ